MRHGSLFSGYGGLDMGVQQVLPGELAWVCEKDPAAAKVLAHRYPGVPNLGDITEADWDQVEPVDVLTGGFPCQDISLAGLRAGLTTGTRSGLWSHMATAIATLQPKLVVIENVRGLLSARADRGVEPEPPCLGDEPDVPALRALGAVLGDLAGIRFDAEWIGLPASDVDACHGRYRVCALAWPSARYAPVFGRHPTPPAGSRRHQQPTRATGGPGSGPSAADADCAAGARQPDASVRSSGGGVAPGWPGAGGSERRATADSDGEGREGRGAPGWPREVGRQDQDSGGPVTGRRGAAADAQGDGRDEGRTQPARLVGGPDAVERSAGAPADADSVRFGADERQLRTGEPDTVRGGDGEAERWRRMLWLLAIQRGDIDPPGTSVGDPEGVGEPDQPHGGTASRLDVKPVAGAVHRDRQRGPAEGVHELGRAAPVLAWGPYAAAIRRWELTLGRPAPAPTEPGTKGQPRLSPRFVEWMMGIPAGHVTAVPGLSRNDMLRLLGNGVVPQQIAAALPVLLARAGLGVAA